MITLLRSAAAVVVLTAAASAPAHFAWLYLDDERQARVFFGEGLDNRDYHLPEKVAAAEVWQTDIDAPNKLLAMDAYDEEGFVGLLADDMIEPRGRLRSQVVYGNYHGSKLIYYTQHYAAANPHTWPTEPDADLPLQALLRVEGGDLKAQILWRGEPLTGATATLSHEGAAEDETGVSAAADGDGVVTFAMDQVVEGLNGLMVMHTDKSESGELDGKPYESASHILTVTFHHEPEAAKVGALPPLPEALASFGAAVAGDWLYVYGGHIGQAHDHSRDNLSKHFRRVRLDGDGGWEDLPSGPALQGLALVEHGGKLYRIGGLDARNASGDDEDLHSVDAFASFDPSENAWTELPPLPARRSSHDAVVLGDTLYVVGGWRLSGDSNGEWQAGAIAFDLTDPAAGWRELPEPPFKRRALAVGHAAGKVVVLCGMTDDGDLSRDVFLLDPATGEWSEGPTFPQQPHHGFGLSAWHVDGVLYAGGMEGVVYRLDDDLAGWSKTADMSTKRFFHRFVPDGRGGMFAVAGASPDVGHTATIERVVLAE